jgi:hypothetical protein
MFGSRWRAFVEEHLPWYDAAVERKRDRQTEAIRLRSIAVRKSVEPIIRDYQQSDRLTRREP